MLARSDCPDGRQRQDADCYCYLGGNRRLEGSPILRRLGPLHQLGWVVDDPLPDFPIENLPDELHVLRRHPLGTVFLERCADFGELLQSRLVEAASQRRPPRPSCRGRVVFGSSPAFSQSLSMTFSTSHGPSRTESEVMLSIGVPICTAFFAKETRSVRRVRMVEALQGLRRFPSWLRRGRLKVSRWVCTSSRSDA